jgi:hypothetical protein
LFEVADCLCPLPCHFIKKWENAYKKTLMMKGDLMRIGDYSECPVVFDHLLFPLDVFFLPYISRTKIP